MLEKVRARLAPHGLHTAELALTMLLWQASTGVFLLAIVQQYLPQQLDANAAFPGYALTLYAAARFLTQTPAGWLADRVGPRRTLALGISIAIVTVFLMSQVQDATSFLLFSALYGVGSAAVWPAVMASVGDSVERNVRARVLNTINISQLVGLGLGTMVGVTLLDVISYQAAFVACLSFSALALALAYRGVRVREQAEQEVQSAPSERFGRGIFSVRVMLLAGIALLLSIGATIQAPVVADYSNEVLHTKIHVLGIMLLAPAVVAGFLLIRFGHIADKFGRQLPLMLGLGLAAVCYYLLSQTSNPLLAANLVVLAGLGYAISIPAWGAAALDATEAGGRGLMLGVLGTVQGLGGVVGQAVGGLSNAAWGPVAPFKIGAMLLMLALLLTAMHLYHQRRNAPALASV
ncbi:MAG: MFS transporter [Chloroflexi bacterium]|nr:MFS transporter [Chloroflexota bacterium]